MVKVAVLYGHPTDPEEFERYYHETHMPLVHRIPGLHRVELAKATATPDGGELPYYRIGEVYFESQEQMQQSLGSEQGQQVVQDLDNFASGGVTVFFAEVD